MEEFTSQSSPVLLNMMDKDYEDGLFDDLINYSNESDSNSIQLHDNQTTTSTNNTMNLTFLEPNIDITSSKPSQYYNNLNNEKINQLIANPNNYDINTNDYELIIVEEPQQCRLSCLGEKYRRPIDPAPIIKLTMKNHNHLENMVECPFYLVHVSLWSTDMQSQLDLINDDPFSIPTRILFGSLVSTPSLLKDLNGEKGYYFSFPDLSIKMTGQYRLKFSLIHLINNKVIKEIFSNIFTVYSSKLYPGMKESSPLSKYLAKQGLKLTIRTQLRNKKRMPSV